MKKFSSRGMEANGDNRISLNVQVRERPRMEVNGVDNLQRIGVVQPHAAPRAPGANQPRVEPQYRAPARVLLLEVRHPQLLGNVDVEVDDPVRVAAHDDRVARRLEQGAHVLDRLGHVREDREAALHLAPDGGRHEGEQAAVGAVERQEGADFFVLVHLERRVLLQVYSVVRRHVALSSTSTSSDESIEE